MIETSFNKNVESASHLRNILFCLVVLFTFSIYLATLAPTIFWGDGIELSAVCATGGIAHPTGYPLFTMLGFFFCQIFRQNPAFGTNLMCALFGAIASGLFFIVLGKTLALLPPGHFLHPHYIEIAAAAGALLFAFSPTFWYHATMTEVYTMHMLFVMLLLSLFLRYVTREDLLSFLALFGVWGLAFSNHMLSMTLLPLAIACLWLFIKKAEKRVHLLSAGMLFAAGLLPYLYLPLRAAARPALNWGDPSTLRNFFWVISGGDFKKWQLLTFQPGIPFTNRTFLLHTVKRLLHLVRWLVEQLYNFPPHTNLLKAAIAVGLGALWLWGIAALFRLKRSIAIAFVCWFTLGIVMCLLYNIPDIEPYFLSFYPAILLPVCMGFLCALHKIEIYFAGHKINFIVYPLLLLSLIPLMTFYTIQDKSRYLDTFHYGVKIMRNATHRAIILTFGDNDIYTLWYTQKVLGLRPDVTIVGTNFIHSGWYAAYFEGASPDRPSLTIRQTPVPESKGDFYLDLLLWVIQPNYNKFPILLTATDPYLENVYNVKPVARVRDRTYTPGIPEEYLPTPYLYQISQKE
jgi:hypothetical protein